MTAEELVIGQHYTDGETMVGVFTGRSSFNPERTIVTLATGHDHTADGVPYPLYEAMPIRILKVVKQ